MYLVLWCLKEDKRPEIGVTYAKPHITKQRLTLISIWLSQKSNLKPIIQELPHKH